MGSADAAAITNTHTEIHRHIQGHTLKPIRSHITTDPDNKELHTKTKAMCCDSEGSSWTDGSSGSGESACLLTQPRTSPPNDGVSADQHVCLHV